MHTDKKYNKVIEEWRVQAMLSYLYNHIEIDSREKLLDVISNYQDFVAETVYDPSGSPEKESSQKHLNGYIYDSLMYRYIRAREAMAQLEKESDCSIDSFKQARRDIMRFCQILNEAMGEHD